MAKTSGLTSDGTASNATFTGKIATNNKFSTQSVFDLTEKLNITYDIKIAPEHVGKSGYIYIAAVYNNNWYMKLPNGTWLPWNFSAVTLLPNSNLKTLGNVESIVVEKQLSLLPGDFKIFVGYKVDDSINYNNEPLSFNVTTISTCP